MRITTNHTAPTTTGEDDRWVVMIVDDTRMKTYHGEVNEMVYHAVDHLQAQNQKLREAGKELLHLHLCEQEGMTSGQPSPQQWLEAVDKLSEALKETEG